MKKNNPKPALIGVWLDHTEAKFIALGENSSTIKIIQSEYESRVRIEGETADGTRLGNNRSSNNEWRKNNRTQNKMNHYYTSLSNLLKDYDQIFLFGPGTVQEEMHNFLKKDKHFSDKNITVESAERMTDNQLAARVKKFFAENDG